MKKKIAILGSTGSIGKSLIKIIKNKKDEFEIVLLTANKNYKELLKQTKILKVKNVIISNVDSYKKFKKENKNNKINIYNNFEIFNSIFKKKIEYTMCSIVGLQGLEPTIKIIRFTKTIAIANKESIICGWNLIKRELDKNNTEFIPVDSEHFSIWYGIKNNQIANVKKIFLTASGGPLLNYSQQKIKNVKISQVLNHPNWKMGKKITVDSSTLMNKVFEVIEAKNIFNLNFHKINIIIHPQSFIHSIICFNDGMIKIIAHKTTMEIPISATLLGSKSFYNVKDNLDLENFKNLEFKKTNNKKFPLLNILKYLPNKISLFETILVAANDEFVDMYLKKKINYEDISKNLIKFLKLKEFEAYKKKSPRNLSQIINLNKYVRLKINPKGI